MCVRERDQPVFSRGFPRVPAQIDDRSTLDGESFVVEMPIGCGRANANELLLTGNRIVIGRVLPAPRRDNAVIDGKYIIIECSRMYHNN